MTRILAIDPGGRYCGIVVVEHDTLEHAEVLDRRRLAGPGQATPDLAAWVHGAVDRCYALAAAHRPDLVAVEGVRAPNPHVRRRDGNSVTNPTGIIDTAAVYGALVVALSAFTVAPGGNGSRIAAAYPEGIAKGARLGGPSEHARSAYDVALTARQRARYPQIHGEPTP